jgi:hypothetical protein
MDTFSAAYGPALVFMWPSGCMGASRAPHEDLAQKSE